MLLLLEEMRLGAQVREGMRVRDRTARPCTPSTPGTRRHASHHGPGLSDLRASRSGDTRMHLLHHARARRLSAQMCRVGMLGLGHWVTRGQPGMLRDALMGRERLRHHHR